MKMIGFLLSGALIVGILLAFYIDNNTARRLETTELYMGHSGRLATYVTSSVESFPQRGYILDQLGQMDAAVELLTPSWNEVYAYIFGLLLIGVYCFGLGFSLGIKRSLKPS